MSGTALSAIAGKADSVATAASVNMTATFDIAGLRVNVRSPLVGSTSILGPSWQHKAPSDLDATQHQTQGECATRISVEATPRARSGLPWQHLGSPLSFVPLNGEAKDVQGRPGVRVGLVDLPAGAGGREGSPAPARPPVPVLAA